MLASPPSPGRPNNPPGRPNNQCTQGMGGVVHSGEISLPHPLCQWTQGMGGGAQWGVNISVGGNIFCGHTDATGENSEAASVWKIWRCGKQPKTTTHNPTHCTGRQEIKFNGGGGEDCFQDLAQWVKVWLDPIVLHPIVTPLCSTPLCSTPNRNNSTKGKRCVCALKKVGSASHV